MTVSTTGSSAQFYPNGATTHFPFRFRFFQNSDLKVFWQDLTGNIELLRLNSDYTVQGAGAEDGGAIDTTGVPLPNGTLVVSRVMVATQLTSFRNQGEFFAEIHEDAFDRLIMLVQQTIDSQGRGLTIPPTDPLDINLELPSSVIRAGKLLAFDDLGQPAASNLTLAQLEQQPALALSSAAAAAASANASALSATNAGVSATASAGSAVLAQKWAENPEDVPVTAGLFSAHHWSNKAAALAAAFSSWFTRVSTLETKVAALEARQLSIGEGQSWGVYTGTRAAGTTYTNNTGRSIVVQVQWIQGSAGAVALVISAPASGAVDVAWGSQSNVAGGNTVSAIIPAGYSYSLTNGTGSVIRNWMELR